MHCYIIVFGDQSANAQQALEREFPQYHHLVVPDRVWVIGSVKPTCGEVCEAIGMVPGGEHNGVVVRVDDYNGYFARSLWEKIALWQGRS